MKGERAVCATEEAMAAAGLTQLSPPAVLSPAPSTTMSPPLSEPDHRTDNGGRLKIYGKDGQVVLELSHGSDNWEKRWVAVSRKTYWTPPTVNARMEHIASFSDDCSSVQSSPWPVDPYRRKQAVPRRRSGSGGSLLQLACPAALALWLPPSGRARLRRLSRRPPSSALRPPPLSPPPQTVAERRRRRRPSPLPAAGRVALLETLVARLGERRRRPVVRPTHTVRIRAGKAGPSAWQASPRKRPHGGREGATRATRPSPGPSTSAAAAAGLCSPGVSGPAAAASPTSDGREPRSPAQRNGRGAAPCSVYSIDSLLASPSARSPVRPAPRPPPAPPPPSVVAPSEPPPPPPPPPPAPAPAPSPSPSSSAAAAAAAAAAAGFSPLACHQSRYMQYLQTMSAFRGFEQLVPQLSPQLPQLPPGYPAGYPLVSPLLYSQLSHPAVQRPAPLLAWPGSPPPPPPPAPPAAPRPPPPSPAHQASLHSPAGSVAMQPEQDAPLDLSRR